MTHLPDLTVTLVTALVGVFWTSMYYRSRVLTPIAFSHAVLGGQLLLLDNTAAIYSMSGWTLCGRSNRFDRASSRHGDRCLANGRANAAKHA